MKQFLKNWLLKRRLNKQVCKAFNLSFLDRLLSYKINDKLNKKMIENFDKEIKRQQNEVERVINDMLISDDIEFKFVKIGKIK